MFCGVEEINEKVTLLLQEWPVGALSTEHGQSVNRVKGPGGSPHCLYARETLWLGGWTLLAKVLLVPAVPVISVSRPLDYEQIPNGLIYLTVMAKDAGNPPLYSTVPVTIEVFVSIRLIGLYSPRVVNECVSEYQRPVLSLVVKACVPITETVPNPAL